MSAPSTSLYHFRPSEIAVFAEIYLPRKTGYQSTLHDTLEEGFNFDYVKSHLETTNRRKKKRIRELLRDFSGSKGYDKNRIKNMKPCFSGYSIYEVNGVFFDNKRAYKNRNEENYNYRKFIDEDQVQVIRLIFTLELEEFLKDRFKIDSQKNPDEFWEMRHLASNYLELAEHERDQIEKNGKEKESALASFITGWEIDTGLFLFGFLIFHICENIQTRYDKYEQEPQKEIWVTSLWNLRINRVLRI